MGTAAHASIVEALDALKAKLASAPAAAAEPAGRALYHCERLALALAASHAEAVRFAAYTVNHIVTTHEHSFGDDIRQAVAALRAALVEQGHQIHFNY